MAGISNRLSAWQGRSMHFLSALCGVPGRALPPESAADHLIYRLKRWPRLPSSGTTADTLRALSMMSNRPVNRRWILNNSNMQAHQVDGLLQRLVDQDAVEVTDAAKFGVREKIA